MFISAKNKWVYRVVQVRDGRYYHVNWKRSSFGINCFALSVLNVNVIFWPSSVRSPIVTDKAVAKWSIGGRRRRRFVKRNYLLCSRHRLFGSWKQFKAVWQLRIWCKDQRRFYFILDYFVCTQYISINNKKNKGNATRDSEQFCDFHFIYLININ